MLNTIVHLSEQTTTPVSCQTITALPVNNTCDALLKLLTSDMLNLFIDGLRNGAGVTKSVSNDLCPLQNAQ